MPCEPWVNVSRLDISQRGQGGHQGQQDHFRGERGSAKGGQGDRRDTGKTARAPPGDRTGRGDAPLSASAEGALGVPGGGAGRGGGKQPKRPIGDLAGHRGHKRSADLGRERPGSSGCGRPPAAPGSDTGVHRVCPALPPRPQRRRHERAARRADGGASPCTPQRAPAGRPRPARPLTPSDWRLDDGGAGPGTVLAATRNHSTSRGGGAFSGRTRQRGFCKAAGRHL